MKQCPCGSTLDYLVCCNPYLENKAIPETPETLMRSRYTAYTLGNIEYIKKTMHGKPLVNFNEQEAMRWSQSVYWLSLMVIRSWQENEDTGFVEFIAGYLDNGTVKTMHETSVFMKINHSWFYTDGKHIPVPTKSVSRNAPCPCGSNRKFKNCHGAST